MFTRLAGAFAVAFGGQAAIRGDKLYVGVCWSKKNGTGAMIGGPSGFVIILDKDVGVNVVAGMIRGLQSMGGQLMSAATSLVKRHLIFSMVGLSLPSIGATIVP